MLSLPRAARSSALVAAAAIAIAGMLAGAVRLMPWVLDPAVPWRVASPFARGLAAVALETALLVGWPVGWALAACRFVESGEARVLLALGERPARTVARLARQGAGFALALAAVALVYGSDASAPGRVATELVEQGKASCALATAPATYAIPFTDMTWLCTPGRAPRLVGRGPGALRTAVITASDARIAGDFRALELDDARLRIEGPAPAAIHVASLTMRGMPPWAQASTLPPPLRAAVLATAAFASAFLAALALLLRAARTRIAALVLGAAGPCVSLGLLRLLERADAAPSRYVLVPIAACAAVGAAALAARFVLSRLRRRGPAASTSSRV